MAKIVVSARRSPSGYYLINKLSLFHEVIGVVFERQSFKARLGILRKRKRRLGLMMVADQLLLILYCNLIEARRTRKIIGNIFDHSYYNISFETAILEIENINSQAAKKFILELNPEYVVVNGTSLLTKGSIDEIDKTILNIHVGMTPEYRGSYGGFWALYNGEPDKVGVTIHLIDAGIDTGPILLQSSVSVKNDDTIKTVVYKQQKVGVDLVIQCINGLQQGIITAFRKSYSCSKLYYSPGLTHYLRLKKRIDKEKIRLTKSD
jgi:methionyl-tRNA formyltransferase